MPTDRTAAHVAAIKALARPQHGVDSIGRAVAWNEWDTAALTRVVEQIAAEAVQVSEADRYRSERCATCGFPRSSYWHFSDAATEGKLAYHLFADRHMPPCEPPADAAVTDSGTTDAASAALVAEARGWYGVPSRTGYTLMQQREMADCLNRLAAHVTHLAAEIARLREDIALIRAQAAHEVSHAEAERDALRTACGEIADDMDQAPFFDGDVRHELRQWSVRLRTLAGDATPTGGTGA